MLIGSGIMGYANARKNTAQHRKWMLRRSHCSLSGTTILILIVGMVTYFSAVLTSRLIQLCAKEIISRVGGYYSVRVSFCALHHWLMTGALKGMAVRWDTLCAQWHPSRKSLPFVLRSQFARSLLCCCPRYDNVGPRWSSEEALRSICHESMSRNGSELWTSLACYRCGDLRTWISISEPAVFLLELM